MRCGIEYGNIFRSNGKVRNSQVGQMTKGNGLASHNYISKGDAIERIKIRVRGLTEKKDRNKRVFFTIALELTYLCMLLVCETCSLLLFGGF